MRKNALGKTKDCERCGKPFKPSGKKDQRFCSVDCYVGSDAHKANIAKENDRRESLLRTNQCLHCEREIKVRQCEVDKTKFCCRQCYREYYALRYDRFFAQHVDVEEIQGYDAFLATETLHCPVQGCDWSGVHLSQHCNYVHGIQAAKLKEMLGFNAGTGLVTVGMARELSERWHSQENKVACPPVVQHDVTLPRGPIRKEGIEHFKKARAITYGGE